VTDERAVSPSAGGGAEPAEGEATVEVRADLDVPGETGRQARVFMIWFGCLALAVLLGVIARPKLSAGEEWTLRGKKEIARSQSDRLKVAATAGLLLPVLLTWGLTYWYRRGGGHARGIVVDVTRRGELRVWGRGYGQRIYLPGAVVTERLVDVYAGRLGAWRQRRVRIRRATVSPEGGSSELELATPARASDMDEGLRAEGGEGNCIEVDREAYEALLASLRAPPA
jgi:hypothetical protein